MKKTTLVGCAILLATTVFAQLTPADQIHMLTASLDKTQYPESPSHDETLQSSNDAIVVRNDMMILGGTSDDNRVSVGIGTAFPNTLASLELGDVDKGLLLNRLTQEQIDMFEMALGMADEGMLIYNVTEHRPQMWDGLQWINIGKNELALDDDYLKLGSGEQVDLNKYMDNTDNQDLSGTLQGTKLTIEIENGAPVTVDLSPILQEYEDRLSELEARLNNLTSNANAVKSQRATLYQNVPNPFDNFSTVKYYIPEGAKTAHLVVSNTMGQLISNHKISHRGGESEFVIQSDDLKPGMYYITLYVDREKIDTKRMVIRK